MTTEHHFSVQRTARYYTMGTLTNQTKRVWFCLHGFGQLAQYFGRKFTDLDDGQTLIVVPEGLSRLYLNDEYQRVGASWLTREDRDYEISDFLAYLNSLYDRVLADHDPKSLHITLFGFSQGAAVACRWLNNGHVRADRLFLWAGYFPNGLADLIDPQKLVHQGHTSVETHYVYGVRDKYIAQMDNAAGYLERIQADLPSLTVTAFDGEHRVEPEVLKTLIKEIS